MITSRVESAGLAKKLMDDFADKTGINNKDSASTGSRGRKINGKGL